MNAPKPGLIPPGQILARELDDREWTQADFAAILGRPTQFVSEIVTGKKEITRESAAQIGAALGRSPVYWLNLQNDFLLNEQLKDEETQHSLSDVRRRAALNRRAPINLLKKRGILIGHTLDHLVSRSECRRKFRRWSEWAEMLHRPPCGCLGAVQRAVTAVVGRLRRRLRSGGSRRIRLRG